jgi:hypothetical protein
MENSARIPSPAPSKISEDGSGVLAAGVDGVESDTLTVSKLTCGPYPVRKRVKSPERPVAPVQYVRVSGENVPGVMYCVELPREASRVESARSPIE